MVYISIALELFLWRGPKTFSGCGATVTSRHLFERVAEHLGISSRTHFLPHPFPPSGSMHKLATLLSLTQTFLSCNLVITINTSVYSNHYISVKLDLNLMTPNLYTHS